MSERGTWVSGIVGCGKCREAIKATFMGHPVPSRNFFAWEELASGGGGILAGRIGGWYIGEEADVFIDHIGPNLAAVICHPVRFAVMPENSHSIEIVVACGKVEVSRESLEKEGLV
ncbi:MAG: hypothetical protein RJB58_1206 [Pseudomonadota bacterium]|jgi:hypothetical protein